MSVRWQSLGLSLFAATSLWATEGNAHSVSRDSGACQSESCRIYRRLHEQRIVLLSQEITDELAQAVIAALLYLDSQSPNRPIYLYINSPGGSVPAGMAIYDTMQRIDAPVYTVNVGQALSMAAFLLAAGEPGARLSLPDTQVMIHQPQISGDIDSPDDIEAVVKLVYLLDGLMAEFTGQPLAKLQQDTQQDYYLSAQESQAYGIIDQIIEADILPQP